MNLLKIAYDINILKKTWKLQKVATCGVSFWRLHYLLQDQNRHGLIKDDYMGKLAVNSGYIICTY
jgi:hypothetical protein